LKNFMNILKDEKGQGMIEYIVALGGVVVIAVAIMAVLNTGLGGTDGTASDVVTSVNDAVNGQFE